MFNNIMCFLPSERWIRNRFDVDVSRYIRYSLKKNAFNEKVCDFPLGKWVFFYLPNIFLPPRYFYFIFDITLLSLSYYRLTDGTECNTRAHAKNKFYLKMNLNENVVIASRMN